VTRHRPVVSALLVFLGASALAVGITASASASTTAVTCPTVDQTTGAVTPAPAPGVDWSGCDLDNAIMSGADLAGADLSNATLSGESRQELLRDVNFTGANLSGALIPADLTGSNLTDANLTDASLFDAEVGGVTITGANLTGTTLTNVESENGGITGTPAALPADWVVDGGFLIGPSAYLVGSDVQGVDLAGADLAQATMDSANLTGCDLSGADLSAAALGEADLSDADLSGANLSDAYLVDAQFAGADLGGTELGDATLTGVSSGNLAGTAASLPTNWTELDGYLIGPYASLSGAQLAGAGLSSADLVDANLTGADLASADLSSTDLENATLTGSNLSGADMGTATLTFVVSGGVTDDPAANLPANWSVVAGYLIGPAASLENADLAGADLAGLDLSDAYLTSADLSSADLSGATAVGTHFNSTDLAGANLSGANLSDGILVATDLAGAQLASATLTGVESAELSTTPASLPPDWSIVKGYLVGPGAYLGGADLMKADLAGLDLAGADLRLADLASADLVGADLSNANLNYAVLDYADLQGAAYTGATFTGTYWLGTTCPDGTNSNAYDDGCFSPLDTTPPVAAPAVTAGTLGSSGWYVSAVTVTWNWTDDGTINTSDCTQTSTTSGNGSQTLAATCTDLAGNVGQATYTVKVDTSRPAVSVKGVTNGARYVLGAVPAARCVTTDGVSGVAIDAKLTVTTTGAHGVGRFTATCSGATSVAGTSQAAPVAATYTVLYGFDGFGGLRPDQLIVRSARGNTVRFRLANAAGYPLSTAIAAALASRHDVEVVLTGPGIKPVTASCGWDATARSFSCTLRVPAKVEFGRTHRYKIAAEENVGTGFVLAPAVRGASDPLVVSFER
jgi:uncharacterized protein YjbI with pentapeptide repeats